MPNDPFVKDPIWASKLHQRQYGEGFMLVCPICGHDYVNVSHRTKTVHGWEGRGPALVMECDGECGHAWKMAIGFHKGQSFLFLVR